ncbi:GntR family transcriptional regulator [Streptococcus sp. sy010]|uniref:GntR family transcriptional regulator n=1 Tax=Streptococcus sp. sy010 TaxID=2600148 RepID=UPI0011B4B690|nr:GntR family transcriptional regulator [Streptococcus sp. sy010]TWT16681.1 GntR family transcriptional regulator [Streptococcus sp. sy010]
MLPAYIKIRDELKSEIDQGTWKIGSRLPSERDLASRFAVSRMTLRQAISVLVEEGIVERRVGSGTYVANQRVQERMRGTTSFTEIIKSQGKTPSTHLVSYQRILPNEQEIKHLNIPPNSHIIRMERVRYADDLPVVFEVASIPEKIAKKLDKQAISEHFFQSLTEAGFVIGKSKQTISAKLASKEMAHYLNIQPQSAILSLIQTSYLDDGVCFEYVRSQYVGERFEFYLENH